MCYSIPGKVKDINNKIAVIDYFGEEKKAINEIDGLSKGDYIYAQGGYVIDKVLPDEAVKILSAWKDAFFKLREADLRLSKLNINQNYFDKKLTGILDKTLEGNILSDSDMMYLMNLKEEESLDMLFKTANFLRQKFHKNASCVHGIIEISNCCERKCLYCGISEKNKNIKRYKMTARQIVETACKAVRKYGFQALVLQSGEGDFYSIEELSEIIRQIKQEVAVLIFISFGETTFKGQEKLYKAGARGILLRFETSNPDIYSKLHPGCSLENRINHIRQAYDTGYIIITGALIGLPEQTYMDVINDIKLAKRLNAEMYSFGPFIPHPGTCLGSSAIIKESDILKTLALVRLFDPENSKILVTTGFETLYPLSRKKALLSGASSVMLNVTPIKYRKLYSIYPGKANIAVSVEKQIDDTISLLQSIGRAPSDLGVSY